MSESLRRTDDGTETRPYGRHSVCGSCKYGRLMVRCVHEWRDALGKPADFGEEKGPVRTYRQFSICLHPDGCGLSDGIAVHPEYADVVRCEMLEPRPSEDRA